MKHPQAELAFPFLAKLSASSRRLIKEQATIQQLNPGELILRRGSRVGGAYLIVEGALRVTSLSSSGDEALLYRASRGQSCLLAMNAIFSDLLYPAWVTVEPEGATILNVPGAVFRSLHDSEPIVRDFVMRVLSARVFDLMTAIEELSTRSLDERLRSYLIRRANAEGLVETTHDEIAVGLATAREVVSRGLRTLRDEGVIETARGRIRILQPDRLC